MKSAEAKKICKNLPPYCTVGGGIIDTTHLRVQLQHTSHQHSDITVKKNMY